MDTYVLRAGKLVPRTRGVAAVRAAALAPIALVTGLGAVLRLWDFGSVPGNPFYDAAARSMSLSWHNLFFGALEPGGQVSVDKAPADLWLQVAATKLFGFSGVTVRLPEVIAAILAIPLLYDIVRRVFGRTAGLGAATALAVLPAAILTAHSDTMDSLMMLADLAAVWLVVLGAQRRALLPVVAAGAVLGLAFNIKLFEALIVAPALVVLIALTARRRVFALGGFAAALVTVSLSWVSIASLTPAAHRPAPFGSVDGSIWNVVFDYNGVDRAQGAATAAALKLDPPGPLRFLTAGGHQYLWTVGTALAAAAALVALALARGWRPARGTQRAAAIFFAIWLVAGVALLSDQQRFEPRYLETVTPAIAAAIGIGAASISRRSAAASTCLALALAVPLGQALVVAREHRSDAGLPSRMPPAQVARLGDYLAAHGAGARYEVASESVARATALIVRDARPVLMLEGQGGRPLLSAARLAELVGSGQVRYALLARSPAPAVRWAFAHGRDVSAAAGLPRGTLFRLTATARPTATARSAPPAGRPRA